LVEKIVVPAYAQFEHEHSKAWSAEIAKHDGYVLVIPEYNYGGTYPKNYSLPLHIILYYS
jgi:hypothetical protein